MILAGGSGTRLWPMSRETYPKQLLRLSGDNTLLQGTVTRLDGMSGEFLIHDPMIVCNEEHRFLVIDQLESIQRQAGLIPLEPVSRNTAPALGVAAQCALSRSEDPILLVMPADHVVVNLASFHRAVQTAIELASKNMIVTFGIVPTRPETGFGYIKTAHEITGDAQPQAHGICAFIEKPNAVDARAFVESGEYLWNSGLFVVKASAWLSALESFRPDISQSVRSACENGVEDGAFFTVERSAFEDCASESIDYAVMQKLTSVDSGASTQFQGAVVSLDAGWSDVGSWAALLEVNQPDVNGNVLYGDTIARDSRDSVLVSEHRLVAALGLENTVVVETADAVLVMHKDRAQDVKDVVDHLKRLGRDEGTIHRRVYRPWGDYEQLDTGERYQVKRLTVKPGEVLSLQMHHHRAEHWVVVKGTAKVTREEEEFLLTENQSTYIPIGAKHRLENPGNVMLEVIEVQSGSYLGEDDIVRFEDVYNR